jgi:hypothetical protein
VLTRERFCPHANGGHFDADAAGPAGSCYRAPETESNSPGPDCPGGDRGAVSDLGTAGLRWRTNTDGWVRLGGDQRVGLCGLVERLGRPI